MTGEDVVVWLYGCGECDDGCVWLGCGCGGVVCNCGEGVVVVVVCGVEGREAHGERVVVWCVAVVGRRVLVWLSNTEV